MPSEQEKEQREHIRAAAVALSDLNTFGVVQSILEGGHIHSPSHVAAERIIKICKAAMQLRLRDYDRAVKRAGGGNYR